MRFLSISEDVLAFISGIGILQGILLSLLIYFHQKSDKTVNKFLALYLACFSIIMSGPLLLRLIGWRNSFFMAPFPVLAGPLLYFYIRRYKESITWRKAIPHLLLFAVYLIGAWLFVQYLAGKYPGAEDFPEEGFRSPVAFVFFGVRYTQLILYYILSRRELRSYQKSIPHLFSETSEISLNWVKWLINGYVLIILASIIIFFLMTKFIDNFYLLYLINIAIATPYIYLVTYKGIIQPTIWQKVSANEKDSLEQQIHEAEEREKNNNKPQYQKPGLNESRTNEIIAGLTYVLDREKLYQQPELTLQELADKLDCPSYQVSFAINEGLEKSFYDLINGYRVEEAKRLLADEKSKNFTILSVGFEAGFNSKTTFNTVFKKYTGQTPTEYRASQMQQASTA